MFEAVTDMKQQEHTDICYLTPSNNQHYRNSKNCFSLMLYNFSQAIVNIESHLAVFQSKVF
jgi:hypothetical protein